MSAKNSLRGHVPMKYGMRIMTTFIRTKWQNKVMALPYAIMQKVALWPRLQHHCLSFAVVWRLTHQKLFSVTAFLASCAWEVTASLSDILVILACFVLEAYLLTYIFTSLSNFAVICLTWNSPLISTYKHTAPSMTKAEDILMLTLWWPLCKLALCLAILTLTSLMHLHHDSVKCPLLLLFKKLRFRWQCH